MAALAHSPPSVQDPPDKPKFPCTQCGAQYSRLEYLRRHERKHTEHRPFSCTDCSKTFARSDVLLRHRRRCHPNSVEKDVAVAAAKASPEVGTSKSKLVAAAATGSKKSTASQRARTATRRQSSSTSQDAEDSSSNDPLATPQDAPLATPMDTSPLPLPSHDPSSSPEITGWTSAINSGNNLIPSPPMLSPSLMPLFMQLDQEGNSPLDNNSATIGTSPWVTLSGLSGPSAAFNSAPPAGPPSMFSMDPLSTDPALNSLWGTMPMTRMATPPPFTDAELLAYLVGEESAASNQLGLNIFQPERSLINVESIARAPSMKSPFQALDPTDRFYLPPGVFAGCYTVPHWMLPPLYKLCRVASHTLGVLTSQMSIVHEPTFRLDRTHAFIAFSMCTTGTKDPFDQQPLCIGDKNEICPPDPWKWVSAIIRQEKSDMLVKNFARRGRMMSFAESFSLIQALIIYHVPAFLSNDHSNRITGLLFLGSIVQVARQVGLFKTDAEWLKPVVLEGDLELRWKEWVQRETVRRTTWLVYVLDTIAAIEAGTVAHVTPRDVRHFPLPAAAPVWNARTAPEWAEAMRTYPIDYSLDRLAQKTFALRAPSPPDVSTTFPFNADGSPNVDYIPPEVCQGVVWESSPGSSFVSAAERRDCLGTRLTLGPFARLCMVLTLLRGLIEFGEGKRKGGMITQMWAVKPEALDKDPDAGLEGNILAAYKRAFERWRLGWDIDRLCHNPYGTPCNSLVNNPNIPSPTVMAGEPCASRDSTFMHDATPYFWFGTVLMDLARAKLANRTGTPRATVFGELEDNDGSDGMDDAGINYFHGLDYRGMLEVAKQFAHSGEGI